MIQPAIVLSADRETLKTIYGRAMERRVRFSLYIEDMFATGHDGANRATVKQYAPDAMNVVGLALREDKKLVDKIAKGARMHAGAPFLGKRLVIPAEAGKSRVSAKPC